MKASLPSLLAGAAGGAVVAGVIVVAVHVPQSSLSSMQRGAAEPPATVPTDDALRAEVGELRSSVEELSMQLALLESRRPERVEVREPLPETATADDDLRALAAALSDPNAPLPEGLRQGVTEALSEIREQEDRERRERFQDAARTMMDERIDEIAVELGLGSYQTDELRKLYGDQMARMTESIDAARASGDYSGMRDSMTAMRDEARVELQRILTPAQYQRFEDERLGRGLTGAPGGFFGGGGAGRGGARGGRGGGQGE
jgi:hypothetical protein